MRNLFQVLMVVPLLLTACVTTVTPEGQKVRVTDDKRASNGCRLLGEVHARGRGGDDPRMTRAEENAHNALRNEASKLGANLVVITWESPNGGAQRGEAFSCTKQGQDQ